MARLDTQDGKVPPTETAALVAQYRELNERSRWYGTRRWQEPLTYTGISVVAFTRFGPTALADGVALDAFVRVIGSVTFVVLGVLGGILLHALKKMKAAQDEATKEFGFLEDKLRLDRSGGQRGAMNRYLWWLTAGVAIGCAACGVYLALLGFPWDAVLASVGMQRT